MKTINNYYIEKKNVLFRADLNVPVVKGVVTEKSRILSIKPSIKKLIEKKNKIFLLSHFGRPKGIYNKKFSLEFMSSILAKEFEIEKIYFIKELNNQNIKETINNISFGNVCLLENIRFYEGEEKNDADFAKEQMSMMKLQILQQTTVSSFAQANAAPQVVLSLF